MCSANTFSNLSSLLFKFPVQFSTYTLSVRYVIASAHLFRRRRRGRRRRGLLHASATALCAWHVFHCFASKIKSRDVNALGLFRGSNSPCIVTCHLVKEGPDKQKMWHTVGLVSAACCLPPNISYFYLTGTQSAKPKMYLDLPSKSPVQ